MKEIIEIKRIDSRQQLLELQNDSKLKIGTSIVYIYFLTEQKIFYSKKYSNILYIGEACRNKEPTGKRFSQHISPQKIKGSDTGNNLVLSQFFHNNVTIGLKIYETCDRKRDERNLIYSHIDTFGSPPLGQGKIPSSPKNNKRTITHIFDYISDNQNKNYIDNSIRVLENINNIRNKNV